MKIMMIGPSSNAKGGIATVINNFKLHFNHSTIDILYYTTWKEGNLLQKIVHSLLTILKFPFYLKRHQINLVHIHVAQDGSFYRKSVLLIIAKLMKIQTILHVHASQFDEFYKKQYILQKKYSKWIFESADCVVVLSETWKQFYESIAQAQFIVIENGVNVPEVNQYQSQSKSIVSFGRLGRRKGTFDILKVAKRIEAVYPEYQFVLYGDGEVQKVKQEIENNDLKNVQIGGWVSGAEKEKILRECRLHLLPSYQEGMPMAILETMAQGIPNISSTVGGIPKVIESGENGFLIEAGDVDALEEAIRTLLEDELLNSTISSASYQTIKKRFSIENYHEKWCELYKIMSS